MSARAYRAYPAYRDSGVGWLGRVPAGWDVKRLKFCVSGGFQYGANIAAELTDRNLPRYIRITDMNDDGTLKDDTFRSLQTEDALPYLLRDGDILLARSASVGRSFIYHSDMGPSAYAGYLIRISPQKEVIPRFLYYFFNSTPYWQWINSIFIQTTIQNVSAEKYANMFVTIPPMAEQQAIAAFLDRECARLDALMAKKASMLALLEEKRRAIITQAVTKGLNPGAPMKDSGVEWLGQVPAGWEVKRLKYAASFNPTYSRTSLPANFLVSFVPMECVGENGEFYPYDKLIDEIGSGYSYFTDNDVLVAKITPCFENGKGAIAENLTNGIGFGSTEFHVIRHGHLLDDNFIFYFTSSFIFRKMGEAFMYGAGGQKRVPEDYLNNFRMPIPPMAEQQAIAAYLDSACARLDAQRQAQEKSIALLREYRAALITMAVTGQIDVREAAPRLQE